MYATQRTINTAELHNEMQHAEYEATINLKVMALQFTMLLRNHFEEKNSRS